VVILIMTWLIAAGGFAHIVAGSIEAWFLLLNARLSFGAFVGEFFLPSLGMTNKGRQSSPATACR
jgi:formate/nitrite transporter FocA (FNT family)